MSAWKFQSSEKTSSHLCLHNLQLIWIYLLWGHSIDIYCVIRSRKMGIGSKIVTLNRQNTSVNYEFTFINLNFDFASVQTFTNTYQVFCRDANFLIAYNFSSWYSALKTHLGLSAPPRKQHCFLKAGLQWLNDFWHAVHWLFHCLLRLIRWRYTASLMILFTKDLIYYYTVLLLGGTVPN